MPTLRKYYHRVKCCFPLLFAQYINFHFSFVNGCRLRSRSHLLNREQIMWATNIDIQVIVPIESLCEGFTLNTLQEFHSIRTQLMFTDLLIKLC